jgi:hypothetical protein
MTLSSSISRMSIEDSRQNSHERELKGIKGWTAQFTGVIGVWLNTPSNIIQFSTSISTFKGAVLNEW